MSNTVTETGQVITISSIDEDYDLGELLPIHSIRFNAGAADDVCIIKNINDNGASIYNKEASGTDDVYTQYYHGQTLRPYLDYNEGTYSAGAEVTIILQRGMS